MLTLSSETLNCEHVLTKAHLFYLICICLHPGTSQINEYELFLSLAAFLSTPHNISAIYLF